jgi:hypothetical protein
MQSIKRRTDQTVPSLWFDCASIDNVAILLELAVEKVNCVTRNEHFCQLHILVLYARLTSDT